MLPVLIKYAIYENAQGIAYQYDGIHYKRKMQYFRFKELLQPGELLIPVTHLNLQHIKAGKFHGLG